MTRIVSAIIAICVLGTIGYCVGQYIPLDDNPFNVASEPYSLLRQRQATVCMLVGAVLGGILGLMVKWKED